MKKTTNSKEKAQQSQAAQRHEAAQHHRAQHRAPGHQNTPYHTARQHHRTTEHPKQQHSAPQRTAAQDHGNSTDQKEQQEQEHQRSAAQHHTHSRTRGNTTGRRTSQTTRAAAGGGGAGLDRTAKPAQRSTVQRHTRRHSAPGQQTATKKAPQRATTHDGATRTLTRTTQHGAAEHRNTPAETEQPKTAQHSSTPNSKAPEHEHSTEKHREPHQGTKTHHSTQQGNNTRERQKKQHRTQQHTTAPGKDNGTEQNEQQEAGAPAQRGTAPHTQQDTAKQDRTQSTANQQGQQQGGKRGGAGPNSTAKPARRNTAQRHTRQHNAPRHHTAQKNTPGAQQHTTAEHCTIQHGATGPCTTPIKTVRPTKAQQGSTPNSTAPQNGHSTAEHRKAFWTTQNSPHNTEAPRNKTPDTAQQQQHQEAQQHHTKQAPHNTTARTPRQRQHGAAQTKTAKATARGGGGAHHTAHHARAPEDTTVHGQQAHHNTDAEQHRAEPRITKARGCTHTAQQHETLKATTQHQVQRQERGTGGGTNEESTKGGSNAGPKDETKTGDRAAARHQAGPRQHTPARQHQHTHGTTTTPADTQQRGPHAPRGHKGARKAPPAPPQKKTKPRERNTTKEGGRGARGGEQKNKRNGATKTQKKSKRRGVGEGGGGQNKTRAQRPRAPQAGEHKKPETAGVQATRSEKERNTARATPARREPSKAAGQNGQRKGQAHQNAPGGPALPTGPRRAGTRTHARDLGVASPIQKGRYQRPHETAPVHRLSPPSNDGWYGKPDASVTGSTHARPRQRTQPKTEAGGTRQGHHSRRPQTGTTRCAPSAPASAGASGRLKSPVLGRPPRAPRSHPIKLGATGPWVGEGTTATGRPTRGMRATGPDEARRSNAGPRGTPERHPAGHNHGTGSGATTVASCRKPRQHAPHPHNHGTRGEA